MLKSTFSIASSSTDLVCDIRSWYSTHERFAADAETAQVAVQCVMHAVEGCLCTLRAPVHQSQQQRPQLPPPHGVAFQTQRVRQLLQGNADLLSHTFKLSAQSDIPISS